MDTTDPITRLNAAFEGRYRIERELGEGGAAVVYLAVQSEPIRREVAIKVLKAVADSHGVVARFEAERQTLAMLEHPSIAGVIDAGVTADGRPFFVMELVRGARLTDFADQRRLTIRERVALFTQVCGAVQHAHQKGIIHRDLKPSNVLVTEANDRPLAKVIDFGIARAIGDPDASDVRITRINEMIGTPAYMSPEQFDGALAEVDTRSDIYSLGVVLYEMLAGSLPYDSRSYQSFAALAARLSGDPPAPSRRVSEFPDTQDAVAELRRVDARGLCSGLAGDLDAIVLKAMAAEPDRRYATANGLQLDLQRFLDHEPVLARSPTTAYRVGKFVRRHPGSSALGATLALAIGAFGAVQTYQADQIRTARDVADVRRDQAEGLVEFMLGDLRAKLQPLGRLDLLDDVGQAAVGYFGAVPDEEFSDEELLSHARSLYQIGEVRIGEGRASEAQSALEESLRLVQALSDRAPDDTERLFELSQAQFWMGYAAFLAREFDAAETYLSRYRETTQRLVTLAPDNPTYRLEAGFAYSNLGSVREAKGDLDGAVDAYRRTIETTTELVREHPDSVEWLGSLAESHNTLGVVYRKLGRYREALEEHRTELEVKERVLEMAPDHAYWRFRRAMAYFFIGRVQFITGAVDSAYGRFVSESAALDSMVVMDPSNTSWRREAANSYSWLGRTLASMGRLPEARVAFAEARARLAPVVEADSTSFDYRSLLGTVEANMARYLADDLEPADVLAVAGEADQLLNGASDEDLAAESSRIQNALTEGGALEALGRHDDAVAIREGVLTSARALADAVGIEGRSVLAEVYLSLGRLDEAREVLEGLWQLGYREPLLVQMSRAYDVGP